MGAKEKAKEKAREKEKARAKAKEMMMNQKILRKNPKSQKAKERAKARAKARAKERAKEKERVKERAKEKTKEMEMIPTMKSIAQRDGMHMDLSAISMSRIKWHSMLPKPQPKNWVESWPLLKVNPYSPFWLFSTNLMDLKGKHGLEASWFLQAPKETSFGSMVI